MGPVYQIQYIYLYIVFSQWNEQCARHLQNDQPPGANCAVQLRVGVS